jgi:hypothetical protein
MKHEFDPTINGFCRRHHCCRQTAYNEIKAGRLRTYKVGIRGKRISPQADEDWVKSRESESDAA